MKSNQKSSQQRGFFAAQGLARHRRQNLGLHNFAPYRARAIPGQKDATPLAAAQASSFICAHPKLIC
ncbi:hypothetical protein [Mucilaginibacter sp.]|uniref:hypothetical protein n=1 Tax=Mucilaginibacter sp. TaxID=1882438 RepID=UPI0026193566|nr:hypothetical protein [Mucilaginibacter sp.]